MVLLPLLLLLLLLLAATTTAPPVRAQQQQQQQQQQCPGGVVTSLSRQQVSNIYGPHAAFVTATAQVDALAAAFPDCARVNGAQQAVFYAYTPLESQFYQVDTKGTDASRGTVLGLFYANCAQALACNERDVLDPDSLASYSGFSVFLTANTTYVLAVYVGGEPGAGGSFFLNIGPGTRPPPLVCPPVPEQQSAAIVRDVGIALNVSIAGRRAPGNFSAQCAPSYFGESFHFIPNRSGWFTLDTLDTAFDTVLALFRHAATTTTTTTTTTTCTQERCNDDAPNKQFQSWMNVSLVANQTYVVYAGGYLDRVGQLVVRIGVDVSYPNSNDTITTLPHGVCFSYNEKLGKPKCECDPGWAGEYCSVFVADGMGAFTSTWGVVIIFFFLIFVIPFSLWRYRKYRTDRRRINVQSQALNDRELDSSDAARTTLRTTTTRALHRTEEQEGIQLT